MAIKNNELSCSFCGKYRKEVKKLITGGEVFICDECVELCAEIVWEEDELTYLNGLGSMADLPKPKEIYEQLNEYVVGQEETKKVLAVAVYNHYKRIIESTPRFKKKVKNEEEVELEKSNILLLGPTGCGKTLMARTLAKILNVPFTIADATSLTEAGYVGEDVENIILCLLQNADGDKELASRGIIYIDEIDKIARKGENTSLTRDVSGEGVQQALLKLIEGTIANIPPRGGRKHPNQEMLKIDTKNILFICGGAFAGLDDIIETRLGKKMVGFRPGLYEVSKNKDPVSSALKHVLPQDLIKFGLIPEFVGRVPVCTSVESLTEEALLKILTEPKGALVKQYKKLFELDNVELEFTDDALKAIAQEAIKRKTGARGLRSVIENAMRDIMFEAPSDELLAKVVVDEATILDSAEPTCIRVAPEIPDQPAGA